MKRAACFMTILKTLRLKADWRYGNNHSLRTRWQPSVCYACRSLVNAKICEILVCLFSQAAWINIVAQVSREQSTLVSSPRLLKRSGSEASWTFAQEVGCICSIFARLLTTSYRPYEGMR